MKKRGLVCAAVAAVLLLSGCASSSMNKTSGSSPAQKGSFAMQNSAADKKDAGVSPEFTAKGVDTSSKAADQANKIIRFCTLAIEENDLNKLSVSIQSKANELGGYIESENSMEQNLNTVVRIPADKLDDFIAFTEKGFTVKTKNISTQNITDEYVDNDARLNNLKAQEEQILTILKKASTVDEVLRVQTELYKVRGDAEALEAKKKNWDKQVGYATVTINASKNVVVPGTKKAIIGGNEFFKSIDKGFSNTSVSIILLIENILIFAISNIIIIAILAVIGFYGYRRYKKNNLKRPK